MSAQKYIVALTPEQRRKVEIVARSQKHSQRERKRARILLRADIHPEEGALSDETIAEQVHVCDITVLQVRRRFVQSGLEAALFRREQANRKARLLDGAAEAYLIATVCAAPPAGQKRWSLYLLRDRLIEAGYVDQVSHETLRQTLKKMNLSPG